MPYKALGLRLRQARVATGPKRGHNVSQAQMANLVGAEVGRVIHQTSWSEWELGRSEPPLDVLGAVVALSGVDPLWLTFGEDSTAAQEARVNAAIRAPTKAPPAKRLDDDSPAERTQRRRKSR